jgi:hypothetical protein
MISHSRSDKSKRMPVHSSCLPNPWEENQSAVLNATVFEFRP